MWLLDDDYRAFVDKYSNVRNDFEARMTEACKVRICSTLCIAVITVFSLSNFYCMDNSNTDSNPWKCISYAEKVM